MKHVLTQILVGKMSIAQRCLSVAAGVLLALIVVFAGLTFAVDTEAGPHDQLKLWMEPAPKDYCSDDEGPCGYLFSCKDECDEGDNCCPVGMGYTPFICLYGCY